MRKISDSTVRRLALYLRFLEHSAAQGLTTISSAELARRGGTTSAQVRKDLSFFGSFGKRGLGYSVPELTTRIREIMGLAREWKVIIVGAGKIGAALAQYGGFFQRGFHITAVYDSSPEKIGRPWDSHVIRDVRNLERDTAADPPDIAVLAVPAGAAQATLDRIAAAGIKAVLNFAPVQLQAPADLTVRSVNMAMELEGLSFALTNRDAHP